MAAVLAPVGYLAGYRPWQLRWGATRAEGAARMPGDELIRGRRWRATRAVEIAASAESVWPWLAQMGAGRAGWYSYDLVDNGGTPSAREIRPELQTLRVGDRMRFTAGSEDAFTVRRVDPGRCLVLAGRVPAGVVVATFVIHPLGEQRSRLVHRVQFSIRPHPPPSAGPHSWTPVTSSWRVGPCSVSGTGPSSSRPAGSRGAPGRGRKPP